MLDGIFGLVDEIGQPGIGIRLINCEIHLIELTLETILKTKRIVSLQFLMMLAVERR